MGLGEKTVSRVYTCMSLQDYGGSGDMLVLYSPDHQTILSSLEEGLGTKLGQPKFGCNTLQAMHVQQLSLF